MGQDVGAMSALRRPTMPDVARQAGVSLKTVSRVINDEPNVSPATTVRVLDAVEALGFRRNDMAQGLRAGHTARSVGLAIEDLANPIYARRARPAAVVAS